MKRLAVYLSLSSLLILLLMCLLVYYFIFTDDGSRRLFSLAQRLAPGDLQVDSFHGRLAGPLELTGLSYQQEDGRGFQSQHIYLDWHPSKLLSLCLEISELSFTESRLQLPVGDQPSVETDAERFQGVKLPLAVTLSHFSSERFELIQGEGGEPLRIDKLNLSAATQEDRLILSQLDVEAFSSRLSLQGSLGLEARLPLTIELAWTHALEGGPNLSGEGRLSGDLQQLTLEQRLASPIKGRLQALLSNLQDAPEWQAELKLEQGDLAGFTQDFPAQLSGQLRAGGSFEAIDMVAQLRIQESRIGKIDLAVHGDYSDGAIRLGNLRMSDGNGLDLKAVGEYHPKVGDLKADMNWQGLRWPLIAEIPAISSDRGSVQLQGGLDAYRYQLAMQVSRPEVGQLQLDAAGSGTLEQIALETLTIALQKGSIEGSGKLVWNPTLSWQLGVTGEGVDPAVLNPLFPGNLTFNLVTQGEWVADGADAQFQLKHLSGSLRDFPLYGKGEVALKQGGLSVHALELATGRNRLGIDGSLGDHLEMKWLVDAPELDAFWPGLSGRLQANGSLGGTREAPTLKADINAGGLSLETYRVGLLKGEVELETVGEQHLAITLNAQALSGFDNQWDSLKIDVDGQIPHHRLQIELAGDQVPQLSLAGVGELQEGERWQGELHRLKLSSPEAGEWRLESAMAFRLQAAEYALAPFCLVSGKARICSSFDVQADGWKGKLQARQLPLTLLQPLLSDETQISGEANLQAELSAVTGGDMIGEAELRIPKGGLGFPLGGTQEQVDFSASLATATLDGHGLRADMKLPLQRLGGFNLTLAMPTLNLTDLNLVQQPFKGQIKGGITDLAMLSAISPQLQNSRGEFSVDLALEGSLEAPRVNGGARLAQGAVDIPVLGIELRDLDLQVQTPDLETLSLTGSVRSGKGKLSIQGTTRMDAGKGFPSTYKIEGDEWLVVDVPEAEVRVSPSLSFEHNAEKSLLQGEVHLPYARVRPRALPATAVSDSPDLVVIGAEETEKEQADIPLHAQIRLTLGKRVSFDGFGLRGRFTGDLLIIDEPGRPVVGRGRLGITDGVYQAYGQDLKIERGFALFADSPVDNPGLDVRAIREINEVIAGISITGTMKKPKLKLFSTPSMAESDILSYIITGRPGGESSGKTAGALAVMQASGASSVASELGRQLGLEELRVDTGSTLEEASLVAGTYLSPRLYVQYVNKLASSETKIRMRYDMTDRWQLEAETGRTQSGDFFYTFDR